MFAGFGFVSCSEQTVDEERANFRIGWFGDEPLLQSGNCERVLALSAQGISARNEGGAGRAGDPKGGEGIESPDRHADDEQCTEAGKAALGGIESPCGEGTEWDERGQSIEGFGGAAGGPEETAMNEGEN